MSHASDDTNPTPPRRRGRPPKVRETAPTNAQAQPTQPRQPQIRETLQKPVEPSPTHAELADEQLAYLLEDEQLSPFSSYLRYILRRDRAEIARLANALDVSENTIYRWMNGNSEPRAVHLKHLLEVLPDHYSNLAHAISQTFPSIMDSLTTGLREVQKDIYRRVLELHTTTGDSEQRRWQITKAVFESILLHLDSERQGLAVTYAKLMPARADGVHSLIENDMRGHYPWSLTLENPAYLGSTTLAGTAAMLERLQTWDNLSETARLQVKVDEFERSACACPVTRDNRIAGVLIVSSTQTGFFTDPIACQSVLEYAQLLSLAFRGSDFYPFSLLNLVPMPDLKWQREEVGRTYVNRIMACARKLDISRQEAEQHVRADMEAEFEELARHNTEQQRSSSEHSPLPQVLGK